MKIRIFLIGWLLLHLSVRSAAISVDSVWTALDSLSKRQLVQIALAQRIDTLAAFKDTWNRCCLERIQQGFSLLGEEVHRQKDAETARRLKCCHIFHAIPQSASEARLTREKNEITALRQSLVAGYQPTMLACGDKTLSMDTCWFLPGRQPEVLEQALDTLLLDQWSEPIVSPMGIHLFKVIERGSLQSVARHSFPDSQLEQLKAKHHYQPQQEMIERLSKGREPAEGVLFYLDQHPYPISLYRLFAASCAKPSQCTFHAFLKKSLLDAEVQDFVAGSMSYQQLQFSRDSLMIHHLIAREDVPRLQDEVALEAWYESHAAQFRRPSFRGLVLHCTDKQQGKALRKFLRQLPEEERRQALGKVFSSNPSEAPRIEEGLFFEGDNPHVDALLFRGKKVEADAQRPYIQLVGRKVKGPENYQEVRQEVMDAYLLELIHQLIRAQEKGR